MKIAAPLFFASATALETSSTVTNLLAAVGHRNVTHMEALVQGLADESVQVPAWKFDKDIRAALDEIRNIFVGSIQTTLKDAHREHQETINCETDACFMGCIHSYKKGVGSCHDKEAECEKGKDEHDKCRVEVYESYITMAQRCSSLHCFIINWEIEICPEEYCLCPDLMVCHTKGGGYDESCVAQIGSCKGMYGSWLQSMLQHFKSGYSEWQKLYEQCKTSYHYFLSVDMECDKSQKIFEKCLCGQRLCSQTSCTVEYEQCQLGCWASYEVLVEEAQCLEKDRKIDWSATKKIECYIDILLHEYSKEELLTKCGTEECVNVAREEDYKHCHTICIEVDHDGEWPEVKSVSLGCEGDVTPYAGGKQSADQTVWISAHAPRGHHDQYHLGDGNYKCDSNGAEVFTEHRGGGKDRVGENRCTEHLDIDYQIPPCCECDPIEVPICDENFHCKHYSKFDDTTLITEISDCCPEDCGETCAPDVTLMSAGYVGGAYETGEECGKFSHITFSEHSHAWAYNRCPCTDCVDPMPDPPDWDPRYVCKSGVHTLFHPAY